VADSVFQILSDFFARYGYWVVFFGVMLENAGLPVPGETVLIFSGFLAYHGEVRLGRAILTAIAGATIGDSLGYCLGRFGGAAFFERYVRRFRILSRRFDHSQALFLKYGHWAVFVGRFITGLRVFAGPLAGIFRLPYIRFLFFNFTGAIGWATTFGCVGFLFGSSWERLVRVVQRLHGAILEVAVIVVLIALAFYFVKRRKSSAR
jgi:membrane protein DedA with SNARE-associated domain